MRPGGLLFYRGSGFIAWLVRWWTRSRYAHVACFVDGAVYEATVRGVRVRGGWISTANADVISCPIDQAFLLAQIGKPYDWRAITIDVLAKRLTGGGIHVYDSRQGAWDCSRLAAVAAGVDTMGDDCPVTPGELYDTFPWERSLQKRGN